ncbi:hypothetical protein NEF87_004351 [Candidatus Lokiarchaeum ossiferum]|uniref:Riboflavin kinase n=1 Tax=Candidatus Lokiarchaeum ossiferum TaxID=2951803 RepID=A0ABY6HXH4_9ARCH|nr:hypothetical protein NEF87_004351 [Candidatus Lokiarchaeum sp. B-35]
MMNIDKKNVIDSYSKMSYFMWNENILIVLMSDRNENSSNYVPDERFVGEKEWFFLLWISYHKMQNNGTISTPDLCKILPISQQTISRRILELEEKKLIIRNFEGRGGELELTTEGYAQLNNIYEQLKIISLKASNETTYCGTLLSGMGEGAHYIKHPQYLEQFYKKIGFFPYFGTLNLKLSPTMDNLLQNYINNYPTIIIDGFVGESRTYGEVKCVKVQMWPRNNVHNQVSGALLKIQRTSHKSHILEFISEQYLRDFFKIEDGSKICFKFI